MDPTLEALAFLYLTMAHTADGAISGDEMRTLAGSLREWNADTPLETIGEVLRKTVADYKQIGSREAKIARAETCADTLKGIIGADDRARVLSALRQIAEVDGAITDDESAFLAKIEARLG